MVILVRTVRACNSAGHQVAPQGLRGVRFVGYPSRIDCNTRFHSCMNFGAFYQRMHDSLLFCYISAVLSGKLPLFTIQTIFREELHFASLFFVILGKSMMINQ